MIYALHATHPYIKYKSLPFDVNRERCVIYDILMVNQHVEFIMELGIYEWMSPRHKVHIHNYGFICRYFETILIVYAKVGLKGNCLVD